MRWRLALGISALLALPCTAWASDPEAAAFTNVYSTMLERQLFAWHIWTTGVSRMDDGSLFGLTSIVLLQAFAMSGTGILLFKTKGLGFRAGWMVTLPTILGSMVFYCVERPYPTPRDLPSILLFACVASIGALLLMRVLKGTIVGDEVAAKLDAKPKQVDDRRLKMAIRPPAAARKGW